MTPPTTAVDACLPDGFIFDSGLSVRDGAGCLLVAGEVFGWRPWDAGGGGGGAGVASLVNAKGQWHVDRSVWGVLDLIWPKPGETSQPASRADVDALSRVSAVHDESAC